jgi:hypothetical protein
MCIALIGGMDRLKRNYEKNATEFGVNLKFFPSLATGVADRMKNVDAIIVFTGKTSHTIRDVAVRIAKARKIPLRMIHSSGVSSLRTCMGSLVPKKFDRDQITV